MFVSRLGRRAAAISAALAVVVAACSGGSSPAPSTAGDDFGAAEKSKIVVAIPFPDISMFMKYWIADAEGYLEDEGLEVEVVSADDTVAAVISGSADIGIQSAGAAILAVNEGLEAVIVAGHSCRQRFSFATLPTIKTVADLAGKDIVLAGTAGDPAAFERLRVLKEAGWDVEAAGANEVYPGADSATWREFFLAGTVALMPFYQDDLAALVDAGASFPIDELKAWPNDSYVVKKGFQDANPNALGRFFRAVMKASTFLTAPGNGKVPANKARIIEINKANEFDTKDQEASTSNYVFGTESVCENLYYDEAAWNLTIETQTLEVTAKFADGVDLDALKKAQASLGLTNAAPADIPWPPTE